MEVLEVPDWVRAVALVGIDGAGDPQLVLLDSSGNLQAIMQGSYSGVLKPIAVDASGRVIMIPTDPADIWGNAISVGVAELIACMFPVKRYDRRGDLYWMDSFGAGLVQWIVLTSGTGAGVLQSAKYSCHGAYSAGLTGGSDASRYAQIVRRMAALPSGKAGAEVSFCFDTNVEYIELALGYSDGLNQYGGTIRVDIGLADFEYEDSAGAWQDVDADISLYQSLGAWNTMKLVVDSDSHEYIRAMLNNQEYSLSGVSIRKALVANEAHLYVDVKVYSALAQNGAGYIDGVVVTKNEPT